MKVQTQEGYEYAVVGPDGETIIGWTEGTGGELMLGPLEPGTDFKVVSRPVGDTGEGEQVGGEDGTVTVPEATEVPEPSVTGDTLTLPTEEDVRYQITDSEGNVIPGPGGQLWVTGTGDDVTWEGLDPSKDYYLTIETVGPDGLTVTVGPVLIKGAGQGSPDEEDGHACYAWVVLIVLILFVAFLYLVHREGEFDLMTWIVTAVALAVDILVGVFLDHCVWYVLCTVLTVAVIAAAWYHYRRDLPEEETSEEQS